MTKKELPARAANIHRSVASTTACTPATVESLRSFLIPSGYATAQSKKPADKHPAPRAKANSVRPTGKAGARAKKQPVVDILELSGEADAEVKIQDRAVLATEVVNSTLKALSEAVKNPPAQRRGCTLQRTSSNASYSNGVNSRSQTPLQPLSVNRLACTPGEKGHLRRSSSTFSIEGRLTGLRAQAECCRVAFAGLRLIQGQDGSPSIPYLQLESGMSALIGRLITLGFEDLAAKELRILKRRLEIALGNSAHHKAMTPVVLPSKNNAAEPKTDTLVDVLIFSRLKAQGPLLDLMITTQLQAIKILALKRDNSMIEAALEHLRLEVAHSPANMIQQQIKPDLPKSRDKAANQLESLAQSLLAMCPCSFSVEDCKSSKSSKRLAPHAAFELQILALQIRTVWWKISGHRIDFSRELINPFYQYLTDFNCRSTMDKRQKYEFAINAFDYITEFSRQSAGFHEEILFKVYQLFADLAQESSQYVEASRWIEKSKSSAKDCGLSQIRLCILDCRLANHLIRGSCSESSEHLLEILQVAARSLAGNVQGESSELDELLITVAGLRKSAYSVVQGAHRQSKDDRTQVPSVHVEMCSEIILLCLKFLLRYLGDGSNKKEDGKIIAQREHRLGLAAQAAHPVIDSIGAIASLSVRTTLDKWSKLDKGLRNCLALTLILKSTQPDEKEDLTDAKRGHSSPFVSISNAYWYRYLHLKQSGADVKSLRDCLQLSIDSLKNASPCEKTLGRLPSKLEKYAQLFESLRDYGKATETYQETIGYHVVDGLLSKAAEAALTRSMPNALEENGELGPLLRSLNAYPRAAMKATAHGCLVNMVYDDDKLCDGERGVLLEQQLIVLSNLLQYQSSSVTTSMALTAVSGTLLRLYTEEAYPVRRIRVIVRLLAVLLANTGVLDGAQREQVIRKPSNISRNPHQDTGLLGYLPHLKACRNILVGLSQGTLNLEGIEAVMGDWTRLLHDHPDWIALQLQVYDIPDWLSQLELLADFLEMKGLEMTRLSVLHVIVTIHEASLSVQCSSLISRLCELGSQYSRLGYSGAAGLVLSKAERYMSVSDVPAKIALRYQMVQAEVAHTNENLKRCSEFLEKGRALLSQEISEVDSQRLRSKDQSERSRSVGDAAFLLSTLAAAEGQSPKALYLARLCVKGYQRAWAILERSKVSKDATARKAKSEVQSDTAADSASELSMSECGLVGSSIVSHSVPPSYGAAFWSMVPKLSKGLTHLSVLLSRHGLLPEARYYLQEAQRIATKVQADGLIGRQSALLGLYATHGGDINGGKRLLQQAEKLLSVGPRGREHVLLQLSLANHYATQGNLQDGHSALDTAESIIEHMTKKAFIDRLIHKQPTMGDLDLQLRALTLKETKKATKPGITIRKTVAGKNASTRLTKPNLQQDIAVTSIDEIPAIEIIDLKRIRGEAQCERTSIALESGDLESAELLLNEAASYPCDQRGKVSRAVLSSRILYNQKLEQLVADPVYCVIPESTISHPSIRVNGDRRQLQSSSQSQAKTGSAAPTRKQRGKPAEPRTRPTSPSACEIETDVLRFAQDELTEVSKLATRLSSTKTVHDIADVLGKILLLLSVTSPASKRQVAAAFVVYTLELGRLFSMVRESVAIEVERQLSSTKFTHQWPSDELFEDNGITKSITTLDPMMFQAEYIDIIPTSWTAISMTLTESREELLICKMRAGQPPFILRLPLSRHNTMESDDEIFGFDQGKAELQDIVLTANHSTHAAQDMSQKGAKTQWWEVRTTLDARLKDLLHNIESIWFGGFKSVLSNDMQDPDLLARFQQSLQNILDKHLPSRQKSGKGPQSDRVNLDQNVLDLFVGLGNPSDSNDVDEPLMDLLYFVVDIMQFNGERNAYDEVDFDAIAIETIDALRHYHLASRDEVRNDDKQHTILVLDKNLHCFPWESLPCLSGHAVSRVPSLGFMRDRLMRQGIVSGSGHLVSSVGRVSVNRDNGISVLNPGGDLKATQSRFEDSLQELPGWQTIIQEEPTEVQMKDWLENSDIFLYFGHGSGGQYIRPRTIKKLEKCSVALLMGCSSGLLTEAEDFEPYGTPMNYMHAGCPAMLATLWDVTDKDIDKFSSTVLETWGLFPKPKLPASRSPTKKSTKQKGKSKVRDVEEPRNDESISVSLDEAVAQGRNSCLLKYLNGAAPVVYGVPVYLS